MADIDTSNYQSRAEWVGADGVTYGWYTVVLPDGCLYNYTYSSSAGMGYMVSTTKITISMKVLKNYDLNISTIYK